MTPSLGRVALISRARYISTMYVTETNFGVDWLEELRRAIPHEAQRVRSIQSALRQANDGSTELFAIVTVDGAVQNMENPGRRGLMNRIEQAVLDVMYRHSTGFDFQRGYPLVSFRFANA
jgi:hypothetical protein